MEKLFDVVLLNSMIGIVFIAVIFVFRHLTRKMPKLYVHILWLFLVIELLVPAFITNPVYSVRNAFEDIQVAVTAAFVESTIAKAQGMSDVSGMTEAYSIENDMNASADTYFNTYDKDVVKESGIIVSDESSAYFIKAYETDAALESEGNEKNFGDVLKAHFTGKRILYLLWIAGILLFTLIYLEQYLKLCRRIGTAVRVEKNVWETEKTEIPFVMPGFPPRIILPANLSPDKRKDILAHEKMHIRHYDPVVRFLATVALVVHWFNPFVWIAYRFMAKDMEMFCDESVLKNKSLDEKKQYSQTLLDFAMKNNGFSLTTSFGEKNTRRRIEHILYGRKPKQIISILLFAIVLCFGAFFLTGGKGADIAGETEQKEMPLTVEAEKKNEVEIALKVKKDNETENGEGEDAAKQQTTLEFLKEKIAKISTELEAIEKLPKDSRPQERWEELQKEMTSAKEELMLHMEKIEAELAILEITQPCSETELKIAEDFLKAEEAYSWFTGYAEIATNQSDYELLSVDGKGIMYAVVNQEGITSLAALEAYLNNYFQKETVEELMARNVEYEPLFKEENGMLYCATGYIGDWCYDETREMKVEQKDTRDEAVVTLCYSLGNQEISELKYDMVLEENGNWKMKENFTFPLEKIAPLLSSHSGFWDYTGYLDECILWTGYEQFVNQDYDRDGKIDRVYRTYNNEEFLCSYCIEFGNGMELVLLPDFSDKGEPVIQTTDFNGDGENEIIFTMNYYTSTNPMAFGELEIFEKRKDGYQPMELPLAALSEDSYEKGLQFTYELVEKNWIRITCKGTGFSQEFYISDDLCEVNQNLFSDESSDCCVYQAEIIEEDNMPKLKCRIALFDKCSDIEIAAILNYENEMQIERIELLMENE